MINMVKITHQLHSRSASHLIIITLQTTPCECRLDAFIHLIDIVVNLKRTGFGDKYQNVWWNRQRTWKIKKFIWNASFSKLIRSIRNPTEAFKIFMKQNVQKQVNYSRLQCGNWKLTIYSQFDQIASISLPSTLLKYNVLLSHSCSISVWLIDMCVCVCLMCMCSMSL